MPEGSGLKHFPNVSVSQVIGLLEVVDNFSGRVDIAKVAASLLLELDDILPAVEGAELIGLAKVEDGDILLTEEGQRFLKAGVRQRKKMVRENLLKLDLFKKVVNLVGKEEGREVELSALLKLLASISPHSNVETLGKTVVYWGRYGMLLRYDSKSRKVKIVAHLPSPS